MVKNNRIFLTLNRRIREEIGFIYFTSLRERRNTKNILREQRNSNVIANTLE